MNKRDLLPDEFEYKKYLEDNKLSQLLGIKAPEKPNEKLILPTVFSVDPENKLPFPAEFDDLCRLHYIARNRKVLTILEFGVGKSTVILGDAIRLNRKDYYDLTKENIRRKEQYQVFSIDNYQNWINTCLQTIPEELINEGFNIIRYSDLEMGQFKDRICTYYSSLPNICPDLIYLDGPDQFSPKGEIRGLSTRHQDRMPMAADILSIEHFLQPGTLIVVDGRTANARFLISNFDRNWSYLYVPEWDQHFFELQESPLGIYNKRMIDHCLGDDFYKRLKGSYCIKKENKSE